MPRKGWSTAPDGWVQIIRGPRLLSESWPKVGRISADLHPKSNQVRSFEGRWRRPLQSRASAPPEVVVEAAEKRVDGIEAALGALAAVAREPSDLHKNDLWPSRSARLESYLERARKRLAAMNVGTVGRSSS